jgi:polyhydroxyalkanoate synthesis regulator phasin
MANKSLLQQLFDAGMSFTAMTQRRAEAIIRDLVASGHVHTDDMQRAVTELLERSQRSAEKLVGEVRSEVRSGLSAARKASASVPFLRPDATPARKPAASATPVAKVADAPVKKARAKKAPAAKPAAVAKKAPAKAAAKKAATVATAPAPAKKAPAKKAPAKRTASSSAAVRKATPKSAGVKRTAR